MVVPLYSRILDPSGGAPRLSRAPVIEQTGMEKSHSEFLFTLKAVDGFPLSAQRFDPKGVGVKAAVVIACATGVHAGFYKDFARWLASRGVGTITFDYRYSGLSFPPPFDPSSFTDQERHKALLSCPADVEITNTWARKDFRAAIVYASEKWPRVPLILLGHSLGGQISTLISEEWHRVTRVVNVCGGHGFWKNYPDPEHTRTMFEQALVKPLETDGVFRARNMQLGQDLPYGPGKEYCEWLFDSRYCFRREHDLETARRFNKPYIFFGFEDDEFCFKKVFLQHVAHLSHADGLKQSLWIDPSKIDGWPKCGHVMSFMKSSPSTSLTGKRRREDTIWPVYLQYILHGTVDTSLGEHKIWTPADEVKTDSRSKL